MCVCVCMWEREKRTPQWYTIANTRTMHLKRLNSHAGIRWRCKIMWRRHLFCLVLGLNGLVSVLWIVLKLSIAITILHKTEDWPVVVVYSFFETFLEQDDANFINLSLICALHSTQRKAGADTVTVHVGGKMSCVRRHNFSDASDWIT